MKITAFLSLLLVTPFLNAQHTEKPKLIVGIVIDQMCYEYLYRYQDKFSQEGFVLMMNNGTNCRNANYNYVPTFTGPGHASVYTGTTPSNHGIVGNEWYDRNSGKVINCVEDSTVQTIGSASDEGQCSPLNLKANTITDQLKLTYPDAKVISMSIKNRGAILPGGHLSDGSYWFDYATGQFITSSFFETELPSWVKEFNDQKLADKYMKEKWDLLLKSSEYTASGPDNSPYEHLLKGKTSPTFPYNLKEMAPDGDYSLFTHTPFANTLLADFAIRAITAENLGTDVQTDMLCISFSSTDILGHAMGPYSVEIEDMYLRLDLEIKKLIKELEATVGKDQFTIFLTADHAVVPVPQYLKDNKLPGGYFFLSENMVNLEKKLTEKYGDDLILEQENLNIYLDHDKIKSKNLDLKEVEQFVAFEVHNWVGVKRVFTSTQLYTTGSDDEWKDMVRKGFHHSESGDVLFILEPGYLPKSVDSEKARKGTSHGSAFGYDTHVPLLWYGAGIPKQEIFRTIEITDISATLVHILNLQNPNAMTGEPIVEIMQK